MDKKTQSSITSKVISTELDGLIQATKTANSSGSQTFPSTSSKDYSVVKEAATDGKRTSIDSGITQHPIIGGSENTTPQEGVSNNPREIDLITVEATKSLTDSGFATQPIIGVSDSPTVDTAVVEISAKEGKRAPIDSGIAKHPIIGGSGGNGFAPDSIVNGTSADDLIDDQYLDAQGDRLTTGADSVVAGAGNDTIVTDSGNDTVDGGAGDDKITYSNPFNTSQISIIGGDGNDSIQASLVKADSKANISGGTGDDSITTGVTGDNANYTIDAGAGNDIIRSVGGNINLSTGDGNDSFEGSFLSGIANVSGGAGNDSLSVGRFSGGNLSGEAGNDSLSSSDGFSTLNGGEDNDVLSTFRGNNTLIGGVGDDLFVIKGSGYSGIQTITDFQIAGTVEKIDLTTYGFTKFSELTPLMTQVGTDVKITLPLGQIVLLQNIQLSSLKADDFVGLSDTPVSDGIVNGTSADDLIDDQYLDAQGDKVTMGNDSINAGAGNDRIDGNNGNDTMTGGAGDDVFVIGRQANTTDTITDFTTVGAVEKIDLSAFGYTEFSQLQPLMSQNGADVQIVLSNNQSITLENGVLPDPQILILKNIQLSKLSANDFVGMSDTPVSDGIVNGTGEDDVMSDAYVDQTDGDVITENADSINAGDGNDSIKAYGGDDTVNAGSGDDLVSLGDGDDQVYAESGNDTLDGGAGNDLLDGGAGADQMDGGAGNDIATYNSSSAGVTISLNGGVGAGGDAEGDRLINIERLVGSAFNDILDGSDVSNTINGGTGDDVIDGGAGADALFGEAGNDTVLGGDGKDTLSGFTGNDYLEGGNDDDVIAGEQGNDFLIGGSGNDRLIGDDPDGAGNDTLYGGTGADILEGGAGDDLLFGEEDADTIFAGESKDTVYGGTGNDSIFGDAGDDSIMAGDGADTAIGGEGDDSLSGDAGNDKLFGDAGDDVLSGGAGNDALFGFTGDDNISGGDGDDEIAGEAGADTAEGGAGNDTIFSGDGADLVLGDDGNDIIRTGSGNDTAFGGAGNDVIYSEAGNDLVFGGTGNDYIDAGTGNDTVDAGEGNDTVLGGDGDDVISGGTGNDALYGLGGKDTLDGGAGNDKLYGDIDEDKLLGGEGDDLVDAWHGNDTLEGGTGSDTLAGGDDNDSLSGGEGNDVLYGDRQPNLNALPSNDAEILAKITFGPEYKSFGLLYQGEDYNLNALKAAEHEMIVINPAKDANTSVPQSEQLWSEAEISSMKDSGKLVFGYVNLAKVNSTLKEWNPSWTDNGLANGNPTSSAPSWFSAAENSTTRLADFADAGWQQIVLDRVGNMIDQGFQGVLLDDVLEYFSRGTEGLSGTALNTKIAENAGAMRDFIVKIREFADAKTTEKYGLAPAADHHFQLVANGAPYLLQDALQTDNIDTVLGNAQSQAYLNAIDTVLIENYFARGDAEAVAYTTNLYGQNGVSVISVDTDQVTLQQREQIITDAVNAGILPYTTENSAYDILNNPFLQDLREASVQTAGNDTLDGGAGNDTMFGGAGDDIFVVGVQADTTDVITDFSVAGIREKIDLSAFTNLKNFTSDIRPLMSQDGADVKITLPNNQLLILKNVQLSTLSADDFVGVVSNDGIVTGTAGNDRIDNSYTDVDGDKVGDGNDSVVAQGGNDYVMTGDGNDTIDAGDGNDSVSGQAGDDSILGGAGNDALVGDIGADRLDGGSGSDFLEGGAGDDYIEGGVGSATDRDTLYGGDGDDTLVGGSGNDNIFAGAGDDSIIGNLGRDTIDGGTGINTVSYASDSSNLEINLQTNINRGGSAEGDVLVSIDNVTGGSGNDKITGDAKANSLVGGGGRDTLDGGFGNDTLVGGAGMDQFVVGKQQGAVDVIADFSLSETGEQIDLSAFGFRYFAEIRPLMMQDGSDVKIALPDNQYLVIKNVQIPLLKADDFVGIAEGDGVVNGTAFNDAINANYTDRDGDKVSLRGDVIDGAAGNDTINGFAGNDTMTGGTGGDTFVIGRQADTTDVITDFNVNEFGEKIDISEFGYTYFAQVQRLMTQEGADVKIALGNNQFVVLQNVQLSSLRPDDFVNLRGGDSIVSGTAGNDYIALNAFTDIDGDKVTDLDDSISAGAGNDYIDGSTGNDTVTGGAGDDIFVIGVQQNTTDIITDFTTAGAAEKISLTAFGFTYFEEIRTRMIQEGADVRIALPNDQFLIIKNTQLSNLSADDFHNVLGNDGTITGTASNDTIDANYIDVDGDKLTTGADIINAGDGNDLIYFGTGSDTVSGGTGNDMFVMEKQDGVATTNTITDFQFAGTSEKIDLTVFGFTYFAEIQSRMTQAGNDVYIALPTSQTLILKNTQISNLTLDDFVNVLGNDGTVSGTDAGDLINVNYRDIDGDRLTTGNDIINAGAGNDTIFGGGGSDIMTGGTGDDIFTITRQANTTTTITDFQVSGNLERIDLSDFTNYLSNINFRALLSQQGNDVQLMLPNNQFVILKNVQLNTIKLNDFIGHGQYSNNWVSGTDSNDRITLGYEDFDGTRVTNWGDDINGNAGDDTIDGGAGNDSMIGATGNDRFVIGIQAAGTVDIINDFDRYQFGDDQLDLTAFGLTRFTDIMPLMRQVGQDVHIDLNYGQQTVILKDTRLQDMSGDDFVGVMTGNGTVTGTAANDLMTVGYRDGDGDVITMDNNNIVGGAGNDTIDGSGGTDTMTGGAGADRFVIGVQPNIMDVIKDFNPSQLGEQIDLSAFGYTHFEQIRPLLSNEIWGNTFNTIINLPQGQIVRLEGVHFSNLTHSHFLNITRNDGIVTGTAGNDLIDTRYTDVDNDKVGAGNDIIMGGAGNDTMNGGAGNDTMTGGEGDDKIDGGTGNDTMMGGEGEDVFVVGVQANTTDIITDFKTAGTAEKIDLSAFGFLQYDRDVRPLLSGVGDGINHKGGTSIALPNGQILILENVRVESLTADDFVGMRTSDGVVSGTAADDNITLNNYTDVDGDKVSVNGDIILAGAGNDSIDAAAGHDSISGESGNDTIYGGSGYNTMTGGAGDDIFVIRRQGVTTTDIITDFEVNSTDEKIDISHPDYAYFAQVQRLMTQYGNDVSIALGNDHFIVLKNVQLNQLSASDFLNLKDMIVSGTSGSDLIDKSYVDSTDGDKVDVMGEAGGWSGRTNADRIEAGGGNDTINSGLGDDSVGAGAGNDVINGGAGNDVIGGGSGNDVINGDAGDDIVVAEAGNDVINGGAGNDVIGGGSGYDRFIVGVEANAVDTITDFDVFQFGEKLDLTAHGITGKNHDIMKQVGQDVHIALPNNQILILKNVNLGDMNTGDFIQMAGGDGIVTGASGNDNINGIFTDKDGEKITDGEDIIMSSNGNDTLAGGGGQDIFIIQKNPNTIQVIADFSTGPLRSFYDKIDLSAFDFTSFRRDILPNMSQEGADVKIALPDNQILLIKNMNMNTLRHTDFIDPNTNTFMANSRGVVDVVEDHNFAYIQARVGYSDREGDVITNGDDYISIERYGNSYIIVDGGMGNDTILSRVGSIDQDVRGIQPAADQYVIGIQPNTTDVIVNYTPVPNFLNYTSRLEGKIDLSAFGFSSVAQIKALTTVDSWNHTTTIALPDNQFLIIKNFSGDLNNRNLMGVGNGDGRVDLRLSNDPDRIGRNNDTVIGTDGRDEIYGLAGNDSINGEDITGASYPSYDPTQKHLNGDSIDGGDGNDTISGQWNNDTIYGGNGNDLIMGGHDDDLLFGDSIYVENGDDTINGDFGNDTIIGGSGVNLLTGGRDMDVFRFNAADDFATTITDYLDGTDKIQIMGATFSQLNIASYAGGTQITVNLGGDSDIIRLEGVSASQINQSDFLF